MSTGATHRKRLRESERERGKECAIGREAKTVATRDTEGDRQTDRQTGRQRQGGQRQTERPRDKKKINSLIEQSLGERAAVWLCGCVAVWLCVALCGSVVVLE